MRLLANWPGRCSALRSCGSRPVRRSKRNMRLPLNLNLIRALAVALAPRVPLGVPVSRSGPLKMPSKGAIRGPRPAGLPTVSIRGSGAFFPPRPLRLCARPGFFFWRRTKARAEPRRTQRSSNSDRHRFWRPVISSSVRFMVREQVRKAVETSHEPPTSNRAENIGVFEQRGSGESGADDTTPSPRRVEVEQRNELGPPPTRPTHHIKKDKSSQRENPCGPHQTIILPCIRANLPNGHKAPESLAATLHATATERESARFMGTIKGCLQNTLLPMNLVGSGMCRPEQREEPMPRPLRPDFA